MSINLRPFGFTPTESLVYAALLERGFTSAYALGKSLGIARANVYQALNGLVSKAAAVQVSDKPQVFRPVGPDEILAMITTRHMALLDQLEAEVESLGSGGAPATVPFTGQREFGELALRVAARATEVTCIAVPKLLEALTPIWRKRQVDGTATQLWLVGSEECDLPVPVAGHVDEARIAKHFRASTVLLNADEGIIAGRNDAEQVPRGFWSSDPLLTGLVGAAMDALTMG